MSASPVILVSMNVAPVGGLTADVIKCIRGLREEGRQVHVLYAFRDPRTLDAMPDPEVDWQRLYIPKRPPVFAQMLIWLLASLKIRRIRRSEPDAKVVCFERLPLGDVQVGTAPNALWMAVRKKMGLSIFSKIPYRIWCAWMDRLVQRHKSGTIVVFSERDRQALLDRGVPPERLDRVVIPTDTERFQPSENNDRPYITIIGANPTLKGIDLALAVWPTIHERHPELKLRIVTQGWKVKSMVPKEMPGVEVAPFITNVEEYYHSSRLVLMPSMFETWGNVIPEALACGVPVIASSEVPSSELISDPFLGAVFDRSDQTDQGCLLGAIECGLELSLDLSSQDSRHRHVVAYMRTNPNIVSWIHNQ